MVSVYTKKNDRAFSKVDDAISVIMCAKVDSGKPITIARSSRYYQESFLIFAKKSGFHVIDYGNMGKEGAFRTSGPDGYYTHVALQRTEDVDS